MEALKISYSALKVIDDNRNLKIGSQTINADVGVNICRGFQCWETLRDYHMLSQEYIF